MPLLNGLSDAMNRDRESISQNVSGWSVDDLTAAFHDFNVIVARFEESHRILQEHIEYLNSQLETKNAELSKKIEETENIRNYLDLILENIYTGVLVIDPSSAITVFNRAAESITGLKREDVLGRPYRTVLSMTDQAERGAIHTLASGVEARHRRKSIRVPDGGQRDVEFSTSIVRDVNGNPLGVAEVFNDISEIRKLQEKVNQVQTLAALGEMAAGVAHEIRNPLAGIAGFAGLLDRQIPPDDARSKLVKPIIEGVGRLNRIVTDLLSFTRPQRIKPIRVVLPNLLESVVNLFRMSLDETGDSLRISLDPSVPEISLKIDPNLFQQVMLNLLKNAREAIEGAGEIGVSVRVSQPERSGAIDEAEWVELRRMFSVIEIDVSDSGHGIPDDALQKLFHPFFTTKDTGTGLGLAISRKIMQLHKGDISVQSRPNIGTTFTLTFPLYETYEEENSDC